MKRKKISLFWKAMVYRMAIAFLVPILSVSFYPNSCCASNGAPVTIDPNNQTGPFIYGDIVAWNDYRNQNMDIYGFCFSNGQDFPIIRHPAPQYCPDIQGDIMVWSDRRDGNGDIFYCRISCSSTFPIDTLSHIRVTTESADQLEPAIFGHWIVWEDWRNAVWIDQWDNLDIYAFDLRDSSELQITTDSNTQRYPKIFGDIIVWVDDRNDTGVGNVRRDIYGFDLTTSSEFRITTNAADVIDLRADSPGFGYNSINIHGNIVVWIDERNGNWDIYAADISDQDDPVVSQITTNDAKQWGPAIYGDWIVWIDERNDNRDIYGYNLAKQIEFPIITHEDLQDDLDIYGNKIVWTDNRNVNRDIYSTVITELVRLWVVDPNGGDGLQIGQPYQIRWISEGDIDEVLIEFSTDNGNNWTEVNPANEGNTGRYRWQVPNETSTNCFVRISDSDNPRLSDTSDVFTIGHGGGPLLSDLNGDHVVNFFDLAILVGQWLMTD